jgi:hypothetical protein
MLQMRRADLNRRGTDEISGLVALRLQLDTIEARVALAKNTIDTAIV